MGVKFTVLHDSNNIFDNKEKFFLKKLKVILINDFSFFKNKKIRDYKMLIVLEGDTNDGESVFKKFEQQHIPLIRVSRVPKDDIFELVFNIINVQIDFNELTHISNDKIIEALIYIEKNLQDSDLNLKKVSNHLFLNTSYFSRFFSEVMGVGFKDYLIKLRISKGKQLLQKGYTVTEVCMAIGYTNLSYFSKVFKKEVGINPSDYRKRYHFFNKEDKDAKKIL
ncbi:MULTISPECIES: helix-turn-helix domain-containing protein [Oceanobacillus]|uniref:HTH araC/xylS-type domain-containing protein n=1 Tax=Oceanobacillus kimchii TaxID=746691 RepID=A0ABQ5TNK9_9BACI|nr:AraC family transcriptional regulator [Oceanobacillus kimchii]GLO68393.1 hypothetical protein MACH08_41770 [Oceanobacillus kimchii]